VTFGPTPGTVHVIASGDDRRASCAARRDVDGGDTPGNVASTLRANATIAGLPAATNLLVRRRATTKEATDDWIASPSVLVKERAA